MPEPEIQDLIEASQPGYTDWEAKFNLTKHELDRTKNSLRRAHEENQALEKQLDLVSQFDHYVPTVPKWLAPEPKGKHHGTPIFVLSDTHFDEVVRPEELMGLNAYNREIAESRLQRAFEGAVNLPRHWLGSNLTYDGIVMACAGDLITGEIHDELTETNVSKPPGTIEYFLDPMGAGINMLLEEYGKVHIVPVDGNHDRLYKKKRAKGAARDSWSWLFWKVLAREYRKNDKVTFAIPESRDTIFSVYDTRVLLHHGDQFRGGSGIAGILTPLSIGDYRKRRKHDDARRFTGREDLGFDLQLVGHFHHRNSLPGIITVGCLKGYDEYAMTGNFPFEQPSQELLIITPERGVTFQAPIWVQDKDEVWD